MHATKYMLKTTCQQEVPPITWLSGLNSGCQAEQQESLPSEKSHQPYFYSINKDDTLNQTYQKIPPLLFKGEKKMSKKKKKDTPNAHSA